MKHSLPCKILFSLISASLISLGAVQTAAGEIVSTESAIELKSRSAQVDRVNAVLAQQQVRDQLTRMGVDPADAQMRVASLSDSELQALDQRISEMPAGAGGALEVLGIVLLVLLVLELVGVTDIFKSL